jgi:hypothetical protein
MTLAHQQRAIAHVMKEICALDGNKMKQNREVSKSVANYFRPEIQQRNERCRPLISCKRI